MMNYSNGQIDELDYIGIMQLSIGYDRNQIHYHRYKKFILFKKHWIITLVLKYHKSLRTVLDLNFRNV